MKVKDPVCGMQIEDKEAAGTSTYKGERYFFCSESCRDKFIRNPEAFIDKKPSSGVEKMTPKSEDIYTCPMHPEVRQPDPGYISI